MKTRTIVTCRALVVAAAAAAAAGGCSTAAASPGAERSALSREVFGDVQQLQFAKRVQVALPARLAVADVTGDAEAERRRRLTETVSALSEDTATWSDVGSVLTWGGARTHDTSAFEFYRGAASRQHADLLLLSERTETRRVEGNGLGILKLLILPAFLVPTEVVTSRVHVRSAAVDVRNGLVYATTDQQLEETSSSTWAGRDATHREQTDALFTKALPGLRELLARKLRLLEGTR